jgi:uncharacterized damage-inducible protein DinB
MNVAGLMLDAFGRIHRFVHDVVDDAPVEQLVFRFDGEANSIAWLTWHLTRIQDDHIAHVAGTDQVWAADGWAQRFDLPFAIGATGYGQSSEEAASVEVGPELLTAYHDAVYEQTVRFVGHLTDVELDRIVDENWDPPVTLGVRLVSVIADDLQHVGQAAYVLGLAQRSDTSSGLAP